MTRPQTYHGLESQKASRHGNVAVSGSLFFWPDEFFPMSKMYALCSTNMYSEVAVSLHNTRKAAEDEEVKQTFLEFDLDNAKEFCVRVVLDKYNWLAEELAEIGELFSEAPDENTPETDERWSLIIKELLYGDSADLMEQIKEDEYTARQEEGGHYRIMPPIKWEIVECDAPE